jgi:hypothetical protein
VKDKGGGWSGPAFTFTAEAEREIRRAFGFSHNRFPDHGKSAFLRSVAGALTKMASDKSKPATDPRMARKRANRVAAALEKAAAEISKMTETERDVFSLATSGNPIQLEELAATLEKATTGFRKAADGLSGNPGKKGAGPDAVAMFIAAQAAAAWRTAFGVEPKARGRSTFANVLDAILDETGLSRLGVDAIRSAIKGPPKSRKS